MAPAYRPVADLLAPAYGVPVWGLLAWGVVAARTVHGTWVGRLLVPPDPCVCASAGS